MVSGTGRHKTSRPSKYRRKHTPHFKRQSSSSAYSHINLQPAPDINKEVETKTTETETYVRKSSLQDTIADQLALAEKLAPTSLTKYDFSSRSLTFAEIIMSTERCRRDSLTDNGSDAHPSEKKTFKSIGPLKLLQKRKKKVRKWEQFDLSDSCAMDNTSEAGASTSDPESSRAASPKPTTLPSYQVNPYTKPSVSKTPPGEVGVEQIEEPLLDTEPTPTQARFDLCGFGENNGGFYNDEFDSPLNLVDNYLSDSQSTKDKFEALIAGMEAKYTPKRSNGGGFLSGIMKTPAPSNMGRLGRDAFDSLDWDPDLPSTSGPDNSPEPVVLKPQALAYTTVGSLVNPNAVPQFTAPHRIQREGAGRRPLMMMQNCQYENKFQPRGPPPLLSMQNSMQYTQQLGQQSPARFNKTPSSKSSSQPPQSTPPAVMFQLTEQEKDVLQKNVLEYSQPGSETKFGSVMVPLPDNTALNTSDAECHLASVKYLMGEEESCSSNGILGFVQGLGKMQTLQRLAKFDNPMKQAALNRLSEFSVVKPQTNGKVIEASYTASFESMLRSNEPYTLSKPENQKETPGRLDRDYQFPSGHSNPLFRSYGASAAPASRPPGYPKPLTAGPPGLRQSAGPPYTKFPSFGDFSSSGYRGFDPGEDLDHVKTPKPTNFEDIQNTGVPYPAGEQLPWAPRLQTKQNATPKVLGQYAIAPVSTGPHSNLKDTLTLPQRSKYYPKGLPDDVASQCAPLSEAEMKKMGQVTIYAATPEQVAEKKLRDLDGWFYAGQRRINMTAGDHLTELEWIQHSLVNRNSSPNAGGPAWKIPHGGELERKFTKEEVEKMSIAECVAPWLDAAFGTLLSYATQGHGSRYQLSKFTKSPDWQIDHGPKGNDSMFGEDWGKPPQRVSRDPRYQPDPRYQSHHRLPGHPLFKSGR